MSERTEIEKFLLENAKLENAQIIDNEFKVVDNVVQDFAPEIAYLYQYREDEAEEQHIKTGRLHENRILGIILKYYLKGKKKITTGEVEHEYKRFFKEIARSTISTYLNILKKESTLYKERDGRIVYYIFFEEPPKNISPFWFTRIFCIIPAYFDRALYYSNLYIKAEKLIVQYNKDLTIEDKDILLRNFKFIIGLIILKILKNRSSKCVLCQFSKREIYSKLEEIIIIALKDRIDVLPEEILEDLIERYSEIPMFGGINIKDENVGEKIIETILKAAGEFKKDLDFQIMVSLRRKDLRLKQKETLEEQNKNS